MVILTKLSKKDFENILKNYDLGKYKSSKHIFTGTNTIYAIKTTKGRFLLKIYENAKLSFVKDQIRLMEFLSKTKVSTPKIINTNEGRGLFIYENKRLAIQEFAEGKEIEDVKEKLAQDLGKEFGILDKTLLGYKSHGNDDWKEDYEFKPIKWKMNKLDNMDVIQESKKLNEEINKLNKSKLRKSVIHADLCEGNFLVKNNKLTAVIDWDDFHKDYIVADPAVTIGHVLINKKTAKIRAIRVFLKEYNKQMKLNDEEIKALYLFTKRRLLDSASWSINQIDKHKDKKKTFIKWAVIMIKKYRVFSKVSLENFKELLK